MSLFYQAQSINPNIHNNQTSPHSTLDATTRL